MPRSAMLSNQYLEPYKQLSKLRVPSLIQQRFRPHFEMPFITKDEDVVVNTLIKEARLRQFCFHNNIIYHQR